jgi:tetratricopeptide (TPR) repeat protein
MDNFRRSCRTMVRLPLRPAMLGAGLLLASFSIASADDLGACNVPDAQPDDAISACSRVIAAGSVQGHDLAVVYRNRGAGYYRKDANDEALADFERAIVLDPNYALGYRGRGAIFQRKREYDRALADLDTAVRLDPTDAVSRNIHGLVWRFKGDLDRAIADYGEAIRLDPKYAPAYHNRGFAWERKGDLDRAIADNSDAIRLNPKDAMSYNNRGYARYRKNDLDGALTDYNSAIEVDLKLALAYHNRGITFSRRGDLDRAIGDYDEAIRLNPKDISAYTDRGNAWRGKHDPDRAIADYSRAIQIDPNGTLARRGRGQAYEDKHDNDRAIAEYSDALRINPSDAGTRFRRAYVLNRKGAADSALVDYNEVLRLNPKDATAYNNRGSIFRAKKDFDRAIADFTDAIRVDPNYGAALTNRGLTYESKRDLDRARADFRAALPLPPKYDNGKWGHDTAQARLTVLAPVAATPDATTRPATGAATPNSPNSKAIVVPSPAGGKLALVIGNGAYRNAPKLPNPANDARAIAKALRDNGFQVIEATDLDRAGMDRALLDFLKKASSADVRLLFYAGHGTQVDGNNYLVPIDAAVASKSTAQFEMIDIDRILKGLDDEAHANIIILDACRDNPFESRIAPSRSGGRGAGLTGYQSVGTGTLIAFATAPGNTAADGTGTHSPFTAALLKHIATPALEVNQMLTRVRIDVAAATEKKQVPWVNSSLLGEVFLSREQRPTAAR